MNRILEMDAEDPHQDPWVRQGLELMWRAMVKLILIFCLNYVDLSHCTGRNQYPSQVTHHHLDQKDQEEEEDHLNRKDSKMISRQKDEKSYLL